MTEGQPPEEQLLARIRLAEEGDERRRLVSLLLEPYLDRIARWALRLRGDPEEAADLAQDALVAVCSHLDRFRGECRFSTWLYTIVQNQGFKQRRRRARFPAVPLEAAAETPDGRPDPERWLEERDRDGELGRVLATELTPLEAEIFLLHYAEGVPLAALERRLALTNRSGARAFLIAAKRKLRRRMRGFGRRWPIGGRLKPAGLPGLGVVDDEPS